MKLFFLCLILSLPVFAQEDVDLNSKPSDKSLENKSSLPQNSEQEKKKEEQQEFLGPYDREGNYKVQIKKQDDVDTSD